VIPCPLQSWCNMKNVRNRVANIFKKKGKLWYRLALSYICILMVAALFSWFLIDNAFTHLSEEEMQNGKQHVNMLLSRVDAQVNSMYNMDLMLVESNVRKDYIYSPDNVLKEVELIKLLRSYDVITGNGVTTAFFSLNSDYVFSGAGKSYDYVYWDNTLNLTGMTEERYSWKELSSPGWIVREMKDGKKRLLYVFPLKHVKHNRYDQDNFIVNSFTQSDIDTYVADVFGKDFNGAVMLFHKDQLLYTNDGANRAQTNEMLALWKDEDFGVRKNGYLYFGVSSRDTDLRVMAALPGLLFEDTRNEYVRNLLIFGVPLVAASIYLSFRFTHYNYRPIRDVISRISPDENIDKRDELSYIMSGIDEMKRDQLEGFEKIKHQEEILLRQNEELKRHQIRRLLRGEATTEEFAGSAFTIMVVRLRNKDIMLVPAAQMKVEAFSREHGYECVECTDISAMALIKETAGEYEEEIGVLTGVLTPFAPVIGVSVSQTGVSGAGRAYLEAITACEETERSERTWSVFDVKSINYASGEELNREIMYLQQAMQTDNKLLAVRYAGEVLEHIRGMRLVEQKRNRFTVINLICGNINQWGLEMPADELFTAVQTEDFDTFSGSILRIVENVCEQISKANEKRMSNRAQAMLEYISEHCTDYEMSVEQLCKTFAMTEARFTRAIREETGCTPREYIIKMRMERAKDMLTGTMLPVQVVAERVGYGSVSHFIKLFKQHYGVTPSQFKNGIISEEE